VGIVPDGAAFEAFYRENLTRIVRACALVTLERAVAEDIAAEAFTRLWARWDLVSGEDHAGGFVFKTAMRLCYREMRGRRHRFHGSLDRADAIDQALARLDVMKALAQLSLRQRQAVVLRDWAGFETAEVGRLLGMRESTVRVHLATGRERLRPELRVDEGSAP
jgi:RNA polymerase sigma-70 factor (ECF subfamily)